jgi:signal transduction histidine kinase
LCHPDDRARFEQTWRACIAAGDPFELEFRVRRSDGAYRWFLCQVSAVHANGGEQTHWMATLTDVHRHRLLESELHRAIRHRDEFLATLAHEVRSPLQAIRQAMSVVQSPNATPELSARMHAIVDRQLSLLLRFTEDSLDLSRVRWDAMSLVPSSITLQALATATVESVKPVMERAGIALEVEVLDPECELIADPARLTQGLSNVLGNAAKYSAAGGRVHFRVSCTDGDAVFYVQDWGCGIEPERLSEIFDLFSRAPRLGAATRPEGLGVGLAVAQHVAQLHGGSLVAQSEGLGHGSQFILRVPLAAPVAA